MKNIYLLLACCFVNINFLFAQTLTGTASFYHPKFNGRKTATGEIFSNSKMTCACNRLPLNTTVKVTNLNNGKSVIVRVNDRLAANNKRVVDLSETAARQLGFVSAGLCKVSVEVVKSGKASNKKSKKKDSEEKVIETDEKPAVIELNYSPAIVDSAK